MDSGSPSPTQSLPRRHHRALRVALLVAGVAAVIAVVAAALNVWYGLSHEPPTTGMYKNVGGENWIELGFDGRYVGYTEMTKEEVDLIHSLAGYEDRVFFPVGDDGERWLLETESGRWWCSQDRVLVNVAPTGGLEMQFVKGRGRLTYYLMGTYPVIWERERW